MHPVDVAVRGLQQQDAAEQEYEKESWTVISSAMSRDGTRWWREKKKSSSGLATGIALKRGAEVAEPGGGGSHHFVLSIFLNFAPRQHSESEEEARLPKMTAATVTRHRREHAENDAMIRNKERGCRNTTPERERRMQIAGEHPPHCDDAASLSLPPAAVRVRDAGSRGARKPGKRARVRVRLCGRDRTFRSHACAN